MEVAVDLDDVGVYGKMDPSGMIDAVEGFPKLCREALDLVDGLEGLPHGGEIREIAVLGMGGSAIGGDLVEAMFGDELGLPFRVHRGYIPSSRYSSQTLVFAVSYSGNTEETLSAVDHVASKGSQVVAITSGGALLRKAEENHWLAVVVPGGLQPRAALPFLFLPIAIILEKIGMIRGFTEQLQRSIPALEKRVRQWGRVSPLGENYAKKLAHRVWGKIPVVYGMDGYLAAAAYRWKCQFNENSKSPAFCHTLPEMNHNEIVGWEQLDDFSRLVELIFLLDEESHPRVVKRVEVTSELIKDTVGGIDVVHVRGESLVDKLLGTILLGDFASVYLALLNGKDPALVEKIVRLKELMAEDDRKDEAEEGDGGHLV